MNVSLKWWDASGEYRGITITSGQAYVGELVTLLCGAMVQKIIVEQIKE